MKIGHIYEMTLKNGDELYGYTVYKKSKVVVPFEGGFIRTNEYVVGYDGIDGNPDFRRTIKEEDIGMFAEVDA